MKRLAAAVSVVLSALSAGILTGCLMTGGGENSRAAGIEADVVSGASGKYYYEAGSYSRERLTEVLASYPYPAATAVSTVNIDGSPNMAVAVPGLSGCGEYLVFGLAENRTKENILREGRAVVLFFEYSPGSPKGERNRGCRVIARWVGPEENERLNTRDSRERPALYLEIVEILPLG